MFNIKFFVLIALISVHPLMHTFAFAQVGDAFTISPNAMPLEGDRVENLFEGVDFITNIYELQETAGLQGASKYQMWSGSYWPTFKGGIGMRYKEPDFPNSMDWLSNRRYVQARPARSYLPSRIDKLSPAEKYDLLVGDSSWNLSEYVWKQGERSYQLQGFVAPWVGLCHGWAGAVHYGVPAPKKSVTVIGANGHRITFEPSDLKGLVSFLWSQSLPKTKVIGNRCQQSSVPRDNRDRISETSCFDTNPATWHLAITNQIGVRNKSLVMDSTNNIQVWNYPISSYQIKYFNPGTRRPSLDPESAIIDIANYRMDRFSNNRHPDTSKIIGVEMTVVVPNATQPRSGSGRLDSMTSKQLNFVYDLELDSEDNIIGGEWYSSSHPDFLWTFRDTKPTPVSRGDTRIEGEWDARYPFPGEWSKVAAQTSRRGQALAKVVNVLLEMSQ